MTPVVDDPACRTAATRRLQDFERQLVNEPGNRTPGRVDLIIGPPETPSSAAAQEVPAAVTRRPLSRRPDPPLGL